MSSQSKERKRGATQSILKGSLWSTSEAKRPLSTRGGQITPDFKKHYQALKQVLETRLVKSMF